MRRPACAILAALLYLGCKGNPETPAKSPPDASGVRLKESGLAELRRQLVPIRTLAATDDDFTDLGFLRETLRGVRIVQLGEQTHGDGATFEAKVRLIKFLHQELGFGVVAFESGLYDCRMAWDRIRAGDDASAAAQAAIFSLWSESAQVAPLWPYLAQEASSKQPLILAGFDSQFTGRFSQDGLAKSLGSVARKPALARLLQPVISPPGGPTALADRLRVRARRRSTAAGTPTDRARRRDRKSSNRSRR